MEGQYVGRYQYICRHIEAYQHEYKMLIGGQITIEQLPEECVPGFLYFFLRQFIDFVQVKAEIDNQIEKTDELTEDYYFDTYLGVMNRTEEKEYGKENLNMAAHNLIQTHELLEEASESMYLCVMENQKRIAALFARLWNNSKQTMEFLGTEKALKHAIALWNVQEFMDDLYEIALEIPEDVNDRVEELIDALVDYEMPGEQKITKLWEPEDDEDLPFN